MLYAFPEVRYISEWRLKPKGGMDRYAYRMHDVVRGSAMAAIPASFRRSVEGWLFIRVFGVAELEQMCFFHENPTIFSPYASPDV